MHGLDDDNNKRVENRSKGPHSFVLLVKKRCGHVKNQRGTHALYYSITDYVIIEL
jgi:hypothetical protein